MFQVKQNKATSKSGSFPIKKIKTFKLVNYLPVNVSVVVISVVVMFDLTKNRKEKKYTHLTFSI